MRRAAKLFLAVFFFLSGVAFFVDLLMAGSFPLGYLLILAGLLGGLHVVLVWIELRRPRLLLVPMLMLVLLYLAASQIPRHSRILLSPAGRQRMIFDASCLFGAMLLGYRLFLGFMANEGVAHVQLQTELGFAQAIQTTLVPRISFRNAMLEAYGRTIPSQSVGGDLVDLVAADGRVLAYLGDVSGHGIPAGLLMGIVKAAVRQGVLFGEPLPALLDSVNRVLPSVKEPNMFVTVAVVQFDGSAEVEYTVAGHPPLLHYRRSKGDVTRCAMQQFPLGLFPEAAYAADRVRFDPGDLFALVTDGITETTDSQDEEFGYERLEQLLSR